MLVPVAINLLGSRPYPFEEHRVHEGTREAGKLYWQWDAYTEPELQELFLNMPLLNISDAVLIIPPIVYDRPSAAKDSNANAFLPRAYTRTWLINPALQPDDLVAPYYNGPSTGLKDSIRWPVKGRAGYAIPTLEWYFGGEEEDPVKPHYTNEKFVISLDLKLFEIYLIREEVAAELA
ncbi:hypothetical protein N0V83_001219 [Neocucurbitaria cava]|uniref:Uncharacterized protein n=1 Tax=Neocucurbitaria cava TaxID=798079 RepID=A0A9W9CR60_9PLEO|nr:hypothetical protein N0V83_001219 [Neocucurbitaria cava]